MNAVETRSLTKLYEGRAVVDGVDWTLPRGSACAFLGKNGAGKSTTLRMLMGFTRPSHGSASVLGADPWEHTVETKRRIGYVAEQPILPGWLRVDALLSAWSKLYPAWDAAFERRLREVFEIPGKKRVSELSKGQHRRVMLLCSLAQGGDLLILDEPGSGLDVAARRELLSILAEWLAGEDKSLLFSTHIVTDVERIASRVAILKDGRMVADTELDELHDNVKSVRMPLDFYRATRERWVAAGLLEESLQAHSALITVRHFATHGRFVLQTLDEGRVVLSQGDSRDVWLGANGDEAHVLHLPLEDAFLALTGSGPKEDV